MTISAINNTNTTINKTTNNIQKRILNPVSATGYGTLGFGMASVITAANKNIKWHKYTAYIAGALAFLHTGLIEGIHTIKSQSKQQ